MKEQLWYEPAKGEPLTIMFLKNREWPGEPFLIPRGSLMHYAHGPHEDCVFCWMADEWDLCQLEPDRWSDDGGPPPRLRLADFPNLNPRFVCWAFSRNAHPYDFTRVERGEPDDDVILVEDRGSRLPWTIVYSQWIMARWREWGTELGFKRDGHHEAYEVAQLNGHPAEEFDAWLRRKTGA